MTRALLSVSDKTGVVDLARALHAGGVELVSTGGTAALLREHDLPVTDVSAVTGVDEALDGRIKTLHPGIFAGLLAVRERPAHMQVLRDLDVTPIDIVVVNLYPFQSTIERPETTLEQAVEQIDIGGPSMLRAAAKNHGGVLVVVDPADYGRLAGWVASGQLPGASERLALATKVFRHTAAYDAVIAEYLSRHTDEPFPERLTVTYEKVQDLRYGENPHQRAAFYAEPGAAAGTIAGARQLHGKELSYNNINDASAALAIVREFDTPAAVAVKHTNPCGVGVGETLVAAYERAYEADPVSIYGGIVALNRQVDGRTARLMSELFLEIVLAPGFDEDALEVLTAKPNLRLLEVATAATGPEGSQGNGGNGGRVTAKVTGGVLIQDADTRSLETTELQVVTRRAPAARELDDLLFAWKVVKHVKSNAVVLAKDGRTVGIGAGQMNRVGAARIAIEQAGEHASGAVLASDAFFPMPDTLEHAVRAGVTAVIQPGGSRRDNDSIAVADQSDVAMVFTGVRHFKH